MVVCLVKKMSFGGGETFMRNLAIKRGVHILDLLLEDGSGTYVRDLQEILIDNGVRVDSRIQVQQKELPGMVASASEGRPIILHVAWYPRGGHWVVCIGTNSSGAIILDPWYGLSEIPLSALPAYDPKNKGQSTASPNAFSGWYVRAV
jgi:hypothetical protein